MKRLFASRKGFEMEFNMLFAIIAGAIIIFLAIYGATSFTRTSQVFQSSLASKQLLNMLDPVANNFPSYSPPPLVFNKDTRINLDCSESTSQSKFFGRQTLGFQERSGLIKPWTEAGLNISRYNKYIFSENVIEGKKLNIFSKPFYSGFMVDNLIMMSFDKYCFVDSPDFVNLMVRGDIIRDVNLSSSLANCPGKTKRVCFGFSSSGCNISIIGDCSSDCNPDLGIYDAGVVIKNGKRMPYFGESLMLAAIYSSPEIYSCNINRLGKKISELSKVYKEKIIVLQDKDCNSIIAPFLDQISLIGENLSYSKLSSLRDEALMMETENCANIKCRIYAPESC